MWLDIYHKAMLNVMELAAALVGAAKLPDQQWRIRFGANERAFYWDVIIVLFVIDGRIRFEPDFGATLSELHSRRAEMRWQ